MVYQPFGDPLRLTNQQPGHPESAQTRIEQGIALGAQGRLEEAVVCFRQILQGKPECADAHFYLGVALNQLGQLDEAAASYVRALHLEPQRLDALNNLANLGNVRMAHNDAEGAIQCFQEVLRLRPDYAEVHYNLGLVFASVGRFDDAIACYHQAIHWKPDYVEAYTNLGIALTLQRRLEDAIACHQQALRFQPDYVEAHNNLGTALAEQGRLDAAIASYRQALLHQPDHAHAHYNLANALADQARLDEAIASYRQAIGIQPHYPEALYNLGLALARQQRFDSALSSYQEAIRVRPDYADAHLGRAELLLLLGNFQEGWPEYEWRTSITGFRPRPFSVPRWDGGPLQGRTILLHAEQGLGDTLQFLRYVPMVKQRGAMVVLQCPPALLGLATTSVGIDRLLTYEEPLPAFDVHAPLPSLPGIFATDRDSIPGAVPYLAANPARVHHWRSELAQHKTFKVGIVWQGSPHHTRDRQRSVPLMQFAGLAQVPDVALFSLQVGAGIQQLASAGLPVIDLGNRFDPGSLADLAAALVNLDLLISVDSAPAHLAGALGVPVWVALPALPDWRWLLDRPDSPWYPTMRLFRQQQAGKWGRVFEEMALEIGRKVMRMNR
jgi:tetratricopeptide (TPR) repeat protein